DGTSTLQIAINPKDLTAKVYNGTVTVNTNVGAQSIPVTLSVTASPVLVSNPGSVVFNFHTGDTLQPMGISLSTSDVSALSPIAATTTPWITVSQAAGSNSISVSAIPGSMAAGLYSGSVTVTQAGLANSPLTIPVALIINGGTGTGGGATGALGLNPA